MKLLHKIIIGLLLNLSSVIGSYAQTATDDSDKSYADNLAKSCAYAKEHLKYIDEKTKQYFNKSSSKQETTESLNVITQTWEEIRINNECFTIGAQITSCATGKNKANEVVIASSILNLIRNLNKDLESKENSVVTKNLQKSLTVLNSLIKKNCPN